MPEGVSFDRLESVLRALLLWVTEVSGANSGDGHALEEERVGFLDTGDDGLVEALPLALLPLGNMKTGDLHQSISD